MPEAERLSQDQAARWESEAGFDELRQVLLWRWDPIDLAESFPNAASQYDRYASELLVLLRDKGEVDDVVGALRAIEEQRMSGPFSSERELHVAAEYVLAWHSRSIHRWLRRQAA